MPHHRHVHIMRAGHEVATDEDEPGADLGKHALGEASHSGLRHFTVSYGADEPKIDLFTSRTSVIAILLGLQRSIASWPGHITGFV